MAGRRRILVLSKAGVGTMMSSPGIRALNIARVLARALPEATVTLAVPGSSDLTPDAPFRLRTYSNRTLLPLLLRSDLVISQGFPPTALPAFFGRRFVLDFFTNFLIEGLEYRKEHVTPRVRRAWLETQRAYLRVKKAPTHRPRVHIARLILHVGGSRSQSLQGMAKAAWH